jgi:alanyl-tRNA synthetase
VDSSNLVPANDPTLLLTNAGMNQFKDVFLGVEKRDYNRAATSQKCLRVSGKHNDLENVGPSPRHHTFFEMLGNFSFGDYFKQEAIRFAWNLLVERAGTAPRAPLVHRLRRRRRGRKACGSRYRRQAPERVLRFGKKDNWWSMGDTGSLRSLLRDPLLLGRSGDKQVPDGVNKDDEYLEIWNLVFMQYEQPRPDGELIPLPAPSVDTGAGLERLASILQGKDNNYDTDAFTPIMRSHPGAGSATATRSARSISDRYRAIADHSPRHAPS